MKSTWNEIHFTLSFHPKTLVTEGNEGDARVLQEDTELCGVRRTTNLNRTQAALSSGRCRLLISNPDSKYTDSHTTRLRPITNALQYVFTVQNRTESIHHSIHISRFGITQTSHRSKIYLGLPVYYMQSSEDKRPFRYDMNVL